MSRVSALSGRLYRFAEERRVEKENQWLAAFGPTLQNLPEGTER